MKLVLASNNAKKLVELRALFEGLPVELVTFNSAGKQGHQEKSVTIVANTLRNIHMLYIQAEVQAKQ